MKARFLPILFVIALGCQNENGGHQRAAKSKPCKIAKIKDARTCLKPVVEAAEEPNSSAVVVANQKTRAAFQSVLSGLVDIGLRDQDDGFFSLLEAVAAADYLAVVNQHQDEDQFFYFVLSKGDKVVPQVAMEVGFPDIDPYPTNVVPLDWALGKANIDGWHYDDFEEAFANADTER